jgi:hypothetical protein
LGLFFSRLSRNARISLISLLWLRWHRVGFPPDANCGHVEGIFLRKFSANLPQRISQPGVRARVPCTHRKVVLRLVPNEVEIEPTLSECLGRPSPRSRRRIPKLVNDHQSQGIVIVVRDREAFPNNSASELFRFRSLTRVEVSPVGRRRHYHDVIVTLWMQLPGFRSLCAHCCLLRS